MLWTVHPLWKGERAFILGGGPSLKSHDLSLIHKERVIGVNHAFRLGQWVDICFFGDKGWFLLNWKDLRNYGGLIVSAVTIPNFSNKRVLWMGRSKLKGIETKKKDHLAWNSNSGFCAIGLAYHLGVKEIILLGFDMEERADKLNTHWHDYYIKATSSKDYVPPYKRFVAYAKPLADEAERLGLKIINATPGGNLNQFKRIPFEEIVK